MDTAALTITRFTSDFSGRADTRSNVEVKPPCKNCFGYMEEIEKYLDVHAFSYSEKFTARFPWDVKTDVFKPLVDYIEALASSKQTYHHFIYDLKYLNGIFDYRYIKTQYSFAYALEEYDYMMNRLRYVCRLLDNDQYIETKIPLLEEALALEITRAKNGHFYRPCSCGSTCMSSEEFNKKTRIQNSGLKKNQLG